MIAASGIPAPWTGAFASPGARVEHEQRWAALRRLLGRLRRAERTPVDRDELLRQHRNRQLARRLRDQAVSDSLRLGAMPMR